MIYKINRFFSIVELVFVSIGIILILGAPMDDYFALSYIIRQVAIGFGFIGVGLLCGKIYIEE